MLKGRSAIVTGYSRGIVLGVAHAFAIRGAGTACVVRYSPARRPKPVRDMAEFAATEFGKVDLIVNNAGIQQTMPPP
ncbi:hypothetical protein [Cupriavidus sp. IK-TO18]|uniref:hypothetical protein n=1 Tax=Cupriavidus sp. IK-TO18 TaxID=2782182 RepID=UPI00189B21CE|nr:hypothetical protein [Cupriavidus sp. IK-TO18]MBF6989625.1 hypothetical protein [Cupriavidus sp. IK-TO18]